MLRDRVSIISYGDNENVEKLNHLQTPNPEVV